MRIAFLIAAASLTFAAPAVATTFVGTNLGVQILSPTEGNGESVTLFEAPSSTNLFFGGFVPGIRIGQITSGGQDEVSLDTGFSILTSNGSTFSSVAGTINFQHDFGTSGATPYLTGGIGLDALSGGGSSTQTNTILGAGFGVRTKMANGHGGTRIEVRYDRVVTGETGGVDLNVIGVKFGFDLFVD